MISAIVYSSQTGSCKRYARELSRALHLPCAPLRGAQVRADGRIIFVGWLMSGKVVGLAEALKRFDVAAVVGVGMGPVSAAGVEQARAANRLPARIPYFAAQGGLHLRRLKPTMRLAMRVVNRSIAGRLQKKAEKTSLSAQEQATLRMALSGEGEPAAWDCREAIDWARRENGFLSKAGELAR